MATAGNSRASSDTTSVHFSYAQAAKGLSATPGSSTSKTSSGAVTPAKDSQAATTSAAAVMSWAEDAEANDPRPEKPSGSRDSRTQPAKPATAASELTAAALSSPDMGASTASTVTKDDDVSSIPNTSSDSTWENKSQASTSVEKPNEPSEKASQKAKGKKGEQAPAKPLQEAPPPPVNIWQQRAAEQRQKPAKPTTPAALANGVAHGPSSTSKPLKDTESADAKGRVAPIETKPRGSDEEKVNPARHESRADADIEKAKKSARSRPQDKEARPPQNIVALPPDRDQESWPTMETAIGEDRKKALEKTERSDKERKESAGNKTGGKGKWVNVPIVPTVVFNTPMPNSGARRGGRSAARGGAQNGGRTGFGSTGPEKDASAPVSMSNGDQTRRGRPDLPIRESSPRNKRTGSVSSLTTKEKPTQRDGEKQSRPAQADADTQPRGTSVLTDSQNNISGPGQHNTFPRQYPSNRPNKGKRAEWPGQDRRRDGDAVSPLKENGAQNDRDSAHAQADVVPEDAERRTTSYVDGQQPHQSKRGSNDRFGTFSGRERRGGGRGGRGNYSNGHQFTNGHAAPMKPASTYPGPMSPPAFNPEQNPYFPPQSNRYRNGPRSQSVTNESMYRMPAQFGGSQQMPPINTYVGSNGYDYPMMQPMSAVPFGQYGMDHVALFSMVSTQLEYYFSLDNLCKDMFLRKHMDSKGFVFLNVISDFNRIKQLTTDLELIKLVCHQSRNIEYRIGNDGKDRLRVRDSWNQWVLPIGERDPSAQNEGPEQLFNPPIPHPNGFDPSGNPRYPDMSGVSPTGPAAFGNEGSYPAMNGFHPGVPQHGLLPNEGLSNGVAADGVNGNTVPNGHAIDNSTKAVSDEPDSFSDAQVDSLIVILRRQNSFQMPVLPPTSSVSNTSHSRNDTLDESGERAGPHVNSKPNGVGPPSRAECQDNYSHETPTPSASTSSKACSQDRVTETVGNVSSDCVHESYNVLRSQALRQRKQSVFGSCPHDMSVLYQFWSHFLVQNFNTRMYDEFHLFALEDARNNRSEVGLSNLFNFYGASLVSGPATIRKCVARDLVELIRAEDGSGPPAFRMLRSIWHGNGMDARNRSRMNELLDDEHKAALNDTSMSSNTDSAFCFNEGSFAVHGQF